MSVVKTCVASFMAHASWCRRRAVHGLVHDAGSRTCPHEQGAAAGGARGSGGFERRRASRRGIMWSGPTLEDCDSDTGASGGPMTRSMTGKHHHVGNTHGVVGHRNGHHDESVHALGGRKGTRRTFARCGWQLDRSTTCSTTPWTFTSTSSTGKISMTPRRFDFIRAAWGDGGGGEGGGDWRSTRRFGWGTAHGPHV